MEPAQSRHCRSGLIARINQTAGNPVGYVNPMLYKKPSAFNDITQGNNGDFAAAPGWDALRMLAEYLEPLARFKRYLECGTQSCSWGRRG